MLIFHEVSDENPVCDLISDLIYVFIVVLHSHNETKVFLMFCKERDLQ